MRKRNITQYILIILFGILIYGCLFAYMFSDAVADEYSQHYAIPKQVRTLKISN